MPNIIRKRVSYVGNINDSQPVGEIVTVDSDVTPAGYLPCDGRSVLRADYPELFKKIGTKYGAVDDEHFNLPSSYKHTAIPLTVAGSGAVYIDEMLLDDNKLMMSIRIDITCNSDSSGTVAQIDVADLLLKDYYAENANRRDFVLCNNSSDDSFYHALVRTENNKFKVNAYKLNANINLQGDAVFIFYK